jgi:hypothetical protein
MVVVDTAALLSMRRRGWKVVVVQRQRQLLSLSLSPSLLEPRDEGLVVIHW